MHGSILVKYHGSDTGNCSLPLKVSCVSAMFAQIDNIMYNKKSRSNVLQCKTCIRLFFFYEIKNIPRFLEGGRVVRWCWANFQCRGVLQFGLQ